MEDVDLKKAIRQHLEMEDFFTGGFTVRGEKAMGEQAEADELANDQTAEEIEKLAAEVFP